MMIPIINHKNIILNQQVILINSYKSMLVKIYLTFFFIINGFYLN